MDNLLWSPPVPISAEAKLCYDGDAIYVLLSAQEPHIRAEHTGRLGMPCEDSCLEFFFSPVPGDSRYLNIECNPNGCLYLGLGSGARTLVRLLPEDVPIQPQPRRTANGWAVEYSVPTVFVRRFFPEFSPAPGGSIRANCYKCGDLTPQPHYLSWNPVASPEPDFHRPADFGILYFE